MARYTGISIGLQYMPVGQKKFVPWKDDAAQVMANVAGQQKYWTARGVYTKATPKADGIEIEVIARDIPAQQVPGAATKKQQQQQPAVNKKSTAAAERADRMGFGKRASFIRIWSDAYCAALQCYTPEEAQKIADKSIELYENAVKRIDAALKAEQDELKANEQKKP